MSGLAREFRDHRGGPGGARPTPCGIRPAMATRSPSILLLHPGTLYGGSWAGGLPLKSALVSLYSYLRAHDITPQVLDLQTEFGNPAPEQVDAFLTRGTERLLSFDFDVLGVSCWTSMEYLAAVEFATRVRAARPRALIVVGGYHPSARPDDFTYAGSPFDVVVTGEGELALLDLLRDGAVAGGGPARVVDGRAAAHGPPVHRSRGLPLPHGAAGHHRSLPESQLSSRLHVLHGGQPRGTAGGT